MKSDLGIENDAWGWVLSAFALSYAIFELPTGALGDAKGPKKILIRVVLWWSAFTALTGAAFSWFYLVIVRFLFGAGEAGAYPNASIVVSRWFPKQEIGKAQAFIWAAGRVGGAFAPWIVIPIANQFGWRFSFLAMALLGVVWVIWWSKSFVNFPHESKNISSEELALIEQNRRFKQHNHHIPWAKILKDRNVWALMLMFHFFMYGAYFFTGWLPTYLKEGRHFGKSEMQLFATLPFVLGAIGCFSGGYVSDWLSKKYGLTFGRRTVGAVGMGISSVIILLAAINPNNQTTAYLLAIGMGFKDLTLPVAFAVCVDIGKDKSGTVSGAMNMVGQLGAVFLGVLFGYIVKLTNNFNYPLFVIAFLLFLGCILWFFINPEKEVDI